MRRDSRCRNLTERCLDACNSIGTVVVILSLLFVLIMFFTSCFIMSPGAIHVIYVNTSSSSYTKVEKNFLSIALDAAVVAEGFHNFNMSDERLIKRIRYLSPGYFRVGGNLADKLYFEPDAKDNKSVHNFFLTTNFIEDFNLSTAPNFTMTGSQWLKLTDFVRKTGFELVFGLNALIRFENGSWDHRNAETLIKFSNDNKIFLNWELGNEPNSFKHKFNEAVNASQLSKDFQTLKKILNKYQMYRKSFLLGPDVTRPLDNHNESKVFLQEFLNSEGGKAVDKITWHQYYLNGRIAKASDFMNPVTFDLLKTQINKAEEIVKSSESKIKAMWLGETSSAYGGGARHLSNTFIGSFLWVDKLGLAAKLGVKVVIRQSIFRGNYAMLDDSYNPNPDWWISILYSNLVGRRLVPYFMTASSKLRFYVHCTKATFYDQFPDSITLFGINLDNTVGKIRIEGLVSPSEGTDMLIYAFELTCDNKITSKAIRLNGKLLNIQHDNLLPSIVPKVIPMNPFVSVPPLSIVFWVIPNSNVKACL